MKKIITMDVGHALVKAVSDDHRICIPSAVQQINESDWKRITSYSNISNDYYVVNGTPYAIGETAVRKGYVRKVQGPARYERSHIGVLVAIMLFEMMDKSSRSVSVALGHAPGYVEYTDKIGKAVLGEWEVINSTGARRVFNITKTYYYMEPIGAMMNVVLDNNGKINFNISDGDTLVIDIGGFTIDVIIVSNGEVDISSAYSSTSVGINYSVELLEKMLRQNYTDIFTKTSKIRLDRLLEAIRTGKFNAGGYGSINCKNLVQEALNPVLSAVADLYDMYGGKAEYNNIILSGGGSALMNKQLVKLLDHPYIYLSGKPKYAHYAIATGGHKIIKLGAENGKL